ncbi:MAG: phage head closure protein [Alteromonadaceae bacterium]|nr:phage head closure protein [Alteromonadaceae bacterium]
MNTGDFNKRITFLRFTETTNDEGFEIKEWLPVATVWSAVKTVQGREFYQAGAVQADRTARFVIRYSKRMKLILRNDLRISYGGRTFEIESIINDDERNVTFTIVTKEVGIK